jgi:anthranilate synthase component 1
MYFFKMGGSYIIGTSPEILVRKEKDFAETRPIAGTRPRGKNESEDVALEKSLYRSVKERAEHVMLVDLGRNDLGKVCRYGTVKVPAFMQVERYSHVMHLVSSVVGKISSTEDMFSLFNACFPAGTVTGAPKVRAMEIIEEIEPVRRGIYAGAIGYFGFEGNMDMAITIRTIVIHKNRAYIQAGAGIVADSSPEREYYETINKAKGMMKAITFAARRKGEAL